jgi:hypothetical protein
MRILMCAHLNVLARIVRHDQRVFTRTILIDDIVTVHHLPKTGTITGLAVFLVSLARFLHAPITINGLMTDLGTDQSTHGGRNLVAAPTTDLVPDNTANQATGEHTTHRTMLAARVINRFIPTLAHRFRYLAFTIERSYFEHRVVFVKIMANYMACLAIACLDMVFLAMSMLDTSGIGDAARVSAAMANVVPGLPARVFMQFSCPLRMTGTIGRGN